MARLLAFTQSVRFGGDDAVLIDLIRAWPSGDAWTVVLNVGHPGLPTYWDDLAGRAEIVTAPLTADGTPGASGVWTAVRTLRRVFAVAAPQAVLVSSGGFPPAPLTLAALIAARRAGAGRLALTAHNDPNLGAGLRAFARDWRGRLAARLCDQVVSVSADCAGKIAAVCGRLVRAILNGGASHPEDDDPSALRRELGVPDDVPLIGAIGNLEQRKGFAILLDAFRLLAAKNAAVRLVIIGAAAEPGEEGVLRRQTADPALAGRATLAGFKPAARRFAAAFDVCAVPSLRAESFGLAALDAMRAGKPVVASRVGGLPEVVADGETGVLVPPGDASALAEALEALLNSPAKARKMSAAGRARAETLFSAERMAREYREVLLGTAK